jgi:hypothetical protein
MGFFSFDERQFGEPLRLAHFSDLHSSVPYDKFSVLRSTSHFESTRSGSHGFLIQLRMLSMREIANIQRDKSVLVPRIVMTGMLSAMVGIIFLNVGKTSSANNTDLQSHFGAIVVILTMALLASGQATLLTFPDERPIFIREYSTNHYQVPAYFASRLVVEAMLVAAQTFVSVRTCSSFSGNSGCRFLISTVA